LDANQSSPPTRPQLAEELAEKVMAGPATNDAADDVKEARRRERLQRAATAKQDKLPMRRSRASQEYRKFVDAVAVADVVHTEPTEDNFEAYWYWLIDWDSPIQRGEVVDSRVYTYPEAAAVARGSVLRLTAVRVGGTIHSVYSLHSELTGKALLAAGYDELRAISPPLAGNRQHIPDGATATFVRMA